MGWALETAEMIAANSPSAVQAVKRQVSATIADHALTRETLEQELGDAVRASRTFAEGIAAFRGSARRAVSEATGDAIVSTRPASRTLGDLVDEIAAATPAAEAVVFRDERLDYAGLKARVDGFARALLAVGIGQGDRVAVLVTNRTEWIVAAFVSAKIGAVVAAGSCRAGAGSVKGRDRRRGDRAARRGGIRRRLDPRFLPRAAGELQGPSAARLPLGGGIPAHADGKDP